ncbi:MAG: hypothetical protein A2Y65_03670 [Deltaproteobacteria bacterium RBG_13_52_11]|nr:MAG: hypothetical protein A2Y65_03670 [Deltaproteobacteria bacterium RBG_13_52_11]
MKKKLDNVPEHLRDRTWYSEGNAYAFLVDAPITLGHSQLKAKTDDAQQEEDSFNSAARHVAKCIGMLRTTLSNLKFDKWNALARYTNTSGKYEKTLVLKASANEAKDEYKIHLVPYFGSHLTATTRLHCAMQGIESQAPGGLLHWVGQRERVVDYDMRDGRVDETVRGRIASFNLPQLASELRKNCAKATTSKYAL